MANFTVVLYLSYSQLCVFLSSMAQPYNDWSDRSYSQGFTWRSGSVSFRTLVEEGDHEISVFVDEPIPPLSADVMRAFKLPFEVDGNIELAGISDSIILELQAGVYSLQVEFLEVLIGELPRIYVRLNAGQVQPRIMKADLDIDEHGDYDLDASPAA